MQCGRSEGDIMKLKIIELALPPYEKENTDVLRNYIYEVENVIDKDPAGWLWSHNRWKTRHLKENQSEAPCVLEKDLIDIVAGQLLHKTFFRSN